MPDLFLSYAHVDKHWVDQFAPLLERNVNQYVGRSNPNRLWKDNRLTGNQPFSPEIHTQLNDAHCLVACLSPGYFASEWCLRELTEFSRRIGSQSNRIFCIELDELALQQKPALTTHMLGYPFWRKDNLSKRSYPLQPGEPAYENLLIDLAKDIAAALKATNENAISTSQDIIDSGTADHPLAHERFTEKRCSGERGPGGEGKAAQKTISPLSEGTATTLIIRRDRLQTLLNRLHEQYDYETREEERMRLEKIIADKQAILNQIMSEIRE